MLCGNLRLKSHSTVTVDVMDGLTQAKRLAYCMDLPTRLSDIPMAKIREQRGNGGSRGGDQRLEPAKWARPLI